MRDSTLVSVTERLSGGLAIANLEHRRLVLVRHSLPTVEPDVRPNRWQLDDEGRARCVPLAESLSALMPRTVYTSHEPKAAETARIVAQRSGAEVAQLDGLEEHHRDYVCPGCFRDKVRRLFEGPNELVFGHESAAAALARFERAVNLAIDDATDSNVVIVSHGTVISMLVAQRSGLDPMKIWPGLATPCYLVLELPGFSLLDIVSDIA